MKFLLQTLHMLLVALLSGFLAVPAALAQGDTPVLEEVVSGQVTLTPGTDLTTIGVTDGSIANYSSFNIVDGHTVRVEFGADAAGGSHLARVLSVNPTNIDGTLWSDGHVYLVNPAGIYFGETASVDVVGLHAAAGRIELDGNSFISRTGESESSRYFDLEGTVQNLGTITSGVVDLIGRHVVNAGTIQSDPGGIENGFFVLVVGDDVTIMHETGPDGPMSVGVTINGLAEELLSEFPTPGLEVTKLLPDSHISAGNGSALFVLGAGDLVGAAMHYAGDVQASEVTLATVGADIEVDGAISAEQTELCASSACFDSDLTLDLGDGPIEVPREISDGTRRDRVELGANASFAGGSLRIQQEGEFRLAVDGPGLDVEQELTIIAGDAISIEQDVVATELGIGAGADGTGDLFLGDAKLHADRIALRAGDGGENTGGSAASETAPAAQVRVDSATHFASRDGSAAPESFSVTQDAELAAGAVAAASQFVDVAAGTTMAYSLRSQEAGGTVDDAIAARLSDDPRSLDWDLTLATAGELSVQADLRAASIDLHGGESSAAVASDTALRIGSEDGAAVTLGADRIVLNAGAQTSSMRFELADQTILESSEGGTAPAELVLRQDAGLDEQILLHDALQRLSIDESLALTLQSDAGFVSVDLDAESLDADEKQRIESLLAQTDLTLANGRVGSIETGSDIKARSLTLSTPNISIVRGDLIATHGDVTLLGITSLRGEGDQLIESVAGRITHGRFDPGEIAPLEKLTTGNLTLLAAAPSGEDRPIDLDENVIVEAGNLVIGSAFSAGRNLTVNSGDMVMDQDALFDGEAEGQQVKARNLSIDAELLRRRTEGDGQLDLVATERLVVSAKAAIDSDRLRIEAQNKQVDLSDALDGAFQTSEFVLAQGLALTGEQLARGLSVADGAAKITLESIAQGLTIDQDLTSSAELVLRSAETMSVQADLTAATLSLEAAGFGMGHKLVVGSSEGAPVRLQADTILLQAGSGTGDAAVELIADPEFANTAGDGTPQELTVRQDSDLRLEDFALLRGDLLRFESAAGNVDLAQAYAPVDTEQLELAAAGDVSITADVTVADLSVQAGSDGVGDVLVGVTKSDDGLDYVEILEQPGIDASSVTFVAGDGSSTDAQVRIGGDTEFDAPLQEFVLEQFFLEQGGSIEDATHIPDLGEFDGALTLRSTSGIVRVETADPVSGTKLTLGGRDGVTIDLGEDTPALEVRSLHVQSIEGGDPLAEPALELFQDLNAFDGDVVLETDTVLRGAMAGATPEYRALAASGDLFAGDVRYLADGEAGFEQGSGLRLDAGGALVVDGHVEFGSTLKGPTVGVVLLGQTVTVRDVSTSGDGETLVEGEPSDRAEPYIFVGASDTARLTGVLQAGSQSGEDLGGVVWIQAGAGIELGSASPVASQETLVLVGQDVVLAGDLRRTAVLVGQEEGDPLDTTDQFARDLVVLATGDVEFRGEVDASGLTVIADGSIGLAGDVTLHAVENSTRLAPAALLLVAGRDDTGDLVIDAQRIEAQEISLRAGSASSELGDAEIDLGGPDGVRLAGSDGEGPESFTVAQAGDLSADRISELVSHLEQRASVSKLSFSALGGSLHARAADLDGSAVRLEGELADGEMYAIEVDVALGAALDVEGLDLFGPARIAGNLAVHSGSLTSTGDLTVAGSADLDTEVIFRNTTGDDATRFQLGGALRASRLESTDPDGLVVDAGEDIDLYGSFDEQSGRLVSAEAVGALDFDSAAAVRLGGDVVAGGNVSLLLPSEVVVDGVQDQRILSTGGRVLVGVALDKTIGRRSSDRSLTIGGEQGLDTSGSVVAQQDLTLIGPSAVRGAGGLVQAREGTLTLATNALPRALGGTEEAAESAEAAATLAAARAELAVAEADATAADAAALAEAAAQATPDDAAELEALAAAAAVAAEAAAEAALDAALEAEVSALAAAALALDPASGGIDATQVAKLSLSAGDGIVVAGTGQVADEILLRGNEIELASATSGTGSLMLDVLPAGDSGRITVLADVDLAESSTLTLASAAEAGIEFSAEAGGGTREVRAGSIVLNPQGREAGGDASIGARGNLLLEALQDRVEMGQGEVLTVLGTLEVRARSLGSLGELNARQIELSAPSLTPNAPGVDWNANQVTADSTPDGALVGTPTTAEVSDALVDDDVLLLALYADHRSLTTADLVDLEGRLLDVTPTGPARFDAARQIEGAVPPVSALPKQVLGQMNMVAAEGRPLLADETLEFLDEAARGGDALALESLANERFANLEPAIEAYSDLFAPVARLDRESGASVLRSHRPRIREALAAGLDEYRASGGPQSGASLAGYLRSAAGNDEADFYLSALRELVELALAGGLDPAQADRFRALLVRDLAADDQDAELLLDALR